VRLLFFRDQSCRRAATLTTRADPHSGPVFRAGRVVSPGALRLGGKKTPQGDGRKEAVVRRLGSASSIALGGGGAARPERSPGDLGDEDDDTMPENDD